MPTTDTSESSLELSIVRHLVGRRPGTRPDGAISEDRPAYAGAGYVQGDSSDYDQDHAVDLAKLLDFLRETQTGIVEQFALEHDGHQRMQFLHRLQGEIAKRGIIDLFGRASSMDQPTTFNSSTVLPRPAIRRRRN